MDISRIRLSEQAFVALVTSALEVFERETIGFLVGSARKKILRVKNAYPYQHAYRSKDEAKVTPHHERKVLYMVNELTGHQFVGEFHSHPHGPNALSEFDIKDIITRGQQLELLIVPIPYKRKLKWGYDRKRRCLRGAVHGFLIEIKAYYRALQTKTIRTIPVTVDGIRKFNKRV